MAAAQQHQQPGEGTHHHPGRPPQPDRIRHALDANIGERRGEERDGAEADQRSAVHPFRGPGEPGVEAVAVGEQERQHEHRHQPRHTAQEAPGGRGQRGPGVVLVVGEGGVGRGDQRLPDTPDRSQRHCDSADGVAGPVPADQHADGGVGEYGSGDCRLVPPGPARRGRSQRDALADEADEGGEHRPDAVGLPGQAPAHGSGHRSAHPRGVRAHEGSVDHGRACRKPIRRLVRRSGAPELPSVRP